MTRLIKWLVGAAIVLSLIYLGLVSITGTKMRDIAEQQLAAYNEQEPSVEAHIEWLETSFWRSSGVLNVAIVDSDDSVQLEHSIELRHGALRAAVSGEVTAMVGDFDIVARIFSEQPVTLDGRIGFGGLSLTYHIPEIHYQDPELNIAHGVAPFEVDLVMRDNDQHSQFTIDWIEMSMNVEGISNITRLEGLHMTAQTSLNQEDGQFEHATTRFNFDTLTVRYANEITSMVKDASVVVEVEREQDEVKLQANLDVAEYEISGVSGDMSVATHTTAMPFASFLAWQQQSGDSDAYHQLLVDLRNHGTQFIIETFDLSLGEMGNFEAEGQFELRDNVQFTSLAGGVSDYLQGELIIKDLPLMLRLSLSGMVTGELPWTLAIRDGGLTINGEPLELP